VTKNNEKIVPRLEMKLFVTDVTLSISIKKNEGIMVIFGNKN